MVKEKLTFDSTEVGIVMIPMPIVAKTKQAAITLKVNRKEQRYSLIVERDRRDPIIREGKVKDIAEGWAAMRKEINHWIEKGYKIVKSAEIKRSNQAPLKDGTD